MLALLVMAITVQAVPITVTWNYNDITGTGGKSFTKDGVTITTLMFIDFQKKNFVMGQTFTTTLGNFTKIQITGMAATTPSPLPSGTGWSGTTWTGNASSVTINGNIYGGGEGNLKIEFTIEPPKVNLSGITLDKTSAEMTVGDAALTLTATVAPDNATDKTVTWTTSDPTVATVADGTVTAVAAGTATITATATNGTADTSDDKTATCTVTVSPQTYNVTVKEGTVDATNWAISPNPATEGQTVTIKYNGKKHVKSIKAVKKDAAADDLGLSVKWADMNLGAEKESDYGDFYAWGETETYYSSLNPITWKEGKSAGYTSSNGWPSYKYHDGSAFTKYTGSDKTVLDAEDDAVVQKLGGGWRLPTKAEWEELLRTSPSYTGADKIEGYEWKTELVDGHVGYRITRTSNGANIFLPAAGECYDTALRSQGTNGLYWSSTLADSDVQRAWSLNFTSSKVEMDDDGRFRGYSIRPVQSKN